MTNETTEKLNVFPDHTFVICAYKESEFLEKCIRSIKRQTVKSNILMTTSTPNEFIKGLALKYNIPLTVREGESNIKDDWNFAYDAAETKWVTVAHQDDLYSKRYVEAMVRTLGKFSSDPIAFVSDYRPVDENGRIYTNINSKTRRLLRAPLKAQKLAGNKMVKRMVLSLGNSICCPAVTYNRERLGDSFFTSDMSFNIDWDTFRKMAEEKGSWAYADLPLTFYRIHSGATSKEFIDNHHREEEDAAMFRKFWPEPVVKLLMKFYVKAYDAYN